MVHCHIGSLEMDMFHIEEVQDVHCHIGSLEIPVDEVPA